MATLDDFPNNFPLAQPVTPPPDWEQAPVSVSQGASSFDGPGLYDSLRVGQYNQGSALVDLPKPLPPPQGQPQSGDAREFQQFFDSLHPWTQAQLILEKGVTPLASQFLAKRQETAAKLAQVEEQRRQHDLQMIEKLMATGNSDALIEYGKANPDSPALLIGQSISKQNLADVIAGVNEGLVPPEVVQRIVKKQATPTEIKAWGDTVVEARKANAKEQAKAYHLQRALNTPDDKRSAYQQQLVEEHQTALELKEADIGLKKAQTAKAQREADEGRLKVTQMADEVSMELFDKPFLQLTPTQREVVGREKERRIQGRTATVIQQGLPAPPEQRSNLIDRKAFMERNELRQPPAGTTISGTRVGDYVEMTDKQREDWSNIVNSGATLSSLFGIVEPLITATNPKEALKQYGRLSLGAVSKTNPSAATYLADAEAFSSRMARVFGSEVGVLTQGDVNRWRNALPTFGDTKAVLAKKKEVFFKIYEQTRSMFKKKIAGEDYVEDLMKLRTGALNDADKLRNTPQSVDELFDKVVGQP